VTKERLRNHTRQLLSSLADPRDVEKFLSSVRVLRPCLIHTREVPNGRDFLFAGPDADIRAALRVLVELEPQGSCPLQLNYAQIETYFLLRVVGSEDCQDLVLSYFEDEAGPPTAG
jgi:hypothetical protein